MSMKEADELARLDAGDAVRTAIAKALVPITGLKQKIADRFFGAAHLPSPPSPG